MEIPSTVVSAGDDVSFSAQYWSEGDEFKYLGLWYNVVAKYNYSLTAPLTGYNITYDSTAVVRELQEIKSYEHSDSNWDPATKSYVIDDTFPVSYTLSTSEVINQDVYNPDQVESWFPQFLINDFYEGFYGSIDGDSSMLADLLVNEVYAPDSVAIMDTATFESYFMLDVVYTELDEQLNDELYGNYFFVDTTVVEGDSLLMYNGYIVDEEIEPSLLTYIEQVPLDYLIYNPNKYYYELGFVKSFELQTQFKVVNGYDVPVFSEEKTVTIK